LGLINNIVKHFIDHFSKPFIKVKIKKCLNNKT
jgi:hypothetical protein